MDKEREEALRLARKAGLDDLWTEKWYEQWHPQLVELIRLARQNAPAKTVAWPHMPAWISMTELTEEKFRELIHWRDACCDAYCQNLTQRQSAPQGEPVAYLVTFEWSTENGEHAQALTFDKDEYSHVSEKAISFEPLYRRGQLPIHEVAEVETGSGRIQNSNLAAPPAQSDEVRDTERFMLIDYVNAADIYASDGPHTVVTKLQRAIDAALNHQSPLKNEAD